MGFFKALRRAVGKADVESEIVGKVSSIQKETEMLKNNLASVDENNYEKTVKRQIINAYYLTEVCDLAVKIID